ncbi:MAG TPA: long-chain fatty acid--CoA ligase [Solirubrobacteraceae bacterium]|nr:long-chain fatty acid--CoA ligase [Solirubrobacteraceae bacterium]
MSNLARLVTEAAERHPERPALKLDDAVLTYAQLDGATRHVAGLLKSKGLEPGDRVGIMLPNVPYFGVVYYGVLRAGGVVVPMNVLLRGREVSFYVRDPEAKILFAWHGFEEAAREGAEEAGAELVTVTPGEFEALVGSAEPVGGLEDRDGSDTAVILYTSGTTGTPKGAELTHDNLYTNCEVSVRTLFDGTERDVILGALPLFHSFGQTCALNAAMRVGALLTLIPRFDAGKALEIIERDQVTIFEGVPTMYHGLLNHPDREKYDVSCLRLCVSGGAALPVEVMRAFEEAFGVKILEGYGLSETSPVASFNHPHKERKPGSIGTPIEGVEMKVVTADGDDAPQGEVGEIAIRGHNVMKGYWRRPDATADVMRDDWFLTGDMAQTDEDGYFFIVDRKKDMIIRGGYNVYPREIEEVLYEHPAVSEAAVIGVPDESMGEEVGAAVVLKRDQQASADDIRSFVKERVAAYKYPRKIWFMDELPKTATGKILKREIQVPERAAR